MSKQKEIIVVAGEKVVRLSELDLRLILDCAGQMLNDGHAFDYYKGIYARSQVKSADEAFERLKGLI